MQVPVFSAHGIYVGSKTCVIVFLVLRCEIVNRIWAVVSERKKKKTCGIMTCGMNNLEID